jgi:hypothetical protein
MASTDTKSTAGGDAMIRMSEPLTIRRDRPGDEAATVRLAALDSAAVPPSPFLLAEVDAELRAALSLANGRVIADPFHPSLYLTALLRVYAATAEWERPRRGPAARRRAAFALEY